MGPAVRQPCPAARVYAARVSIDRTEFIASAVQDERQLDGAWHLELVAESGESDESDEAEGDSMALALRLVIDREGTAQEGEVILTRDGVDESAAVDPGAAADELEPLQIVLSAEFDERETEIAIDQRDDGDFDVRLDVGDAP